MTAPGIVPGEQVPPVYTAKRIPACPLIPRTFVHYGMLAWPLDELSPDLVATAHRHGDDSRLYLPHPEMIHCPQCVAGTERGGNDGRRGESLIDNATRQKPAAPLYFICHHCFGDCRKTDCITPMQAREEAKGDGYNKRDMPNIFNR